MRSDDDQVVVLGQIRRVVASEPVRDGLFKDCDRSLHVPGATRAVGFAVLARRNASADGRGTAGKQASCGVEILRVPRCQAAQPRSIALAASSGSPRAMHARARLLSNCLATGRGCANANLMSSWPPDMAWTAASRSST